MSLRCARLLVSIAALVTTGAAAWSCSLFTSLDGFSDGSPDGVAPRDGTALDGGEGGVTATRWLVIVGGEGAGLLATTWLAPIGGDGQLGAWKAGPPLPSARTDLGVAALAPDAIAAAGGRGQKGNTSEALVAKLEGDELRGWVPQAPLPREIAQQNLVTVTGGVLSIGGFAGGVVDDVYFGRAVEGSIATWTAGESRPPRRTLAGAALSGDVLYVTGGLEAALDSRAAKVTAPGMYSAFRDARNLPEPRVGLARVASGRTLIVLGGVALEPSVLTGRLDELDVPSWDTAPSFTTPRSAHAAVVAGPFVYVLGGVDKNGTKLGDVQFTRARDDGTLESWRQTTPLPTPMRGMGGAVLSSK